MSYLLSKYQHPDKDGRTQHITPATAHWQFVGFSAYILKPKQSVTIKGDINEVCVVIVAGVATVTTAIDSFSQLGDRSCPFEKYDGAYIKPYAVYIPGATDFTITGDTTCEIAICKAPDTSLKGESNSLVSRVIVPSEIGAETRGKGQNVRCVHNILPEWEPAHSLLVVEVFTNEGNTSSYPSHKHDQDNLPDESLLEETYYHRLHPPQGFCMQRVYTDDRDLDECMAVYNKDVVMVPRGYHPVATIAGYDSYYLNVMAGPTKIWKFHMEADHDWIHSDVYGEKQ